MGRSCFCILQCSTAVRVCVAVANEPSHAQKHTHPYPAKSNNACVGVNTLTDNCVTSEFEKNHTFCFVQRSSNDHIGFSMSLKRKHLEWAFLTIFIFVSNVDALANSKREWYMPSASVFWVVVSIIS